MSRTTTTRKPKERNLKAFTALGAALLMALCGLLGACAGPQSATEATLFAWAQACNTHLATSKSNSYPSKSLSEIDPALTSGLQETDGWGNPIFYRGLRDDRYELISAGPDGRFGNEDDVIVQNGRLKVAADIYASNPLKKPE